MLRAFAVALALTASSPAAVSAAAPIVLHGTLQHIKGVTATYTSSRGTFTATFVSKQHYRVAGRVSGKALTGTFRTRQTASGKSYTASGSGRLGGRSVRISGGGPDDLSRATLVLR